MQNDPLSCPVMNALSDVQCALIYVEKQWCGDHGLSGLQRARGDLVHHVCHSIDVEPFDTAQDGARVLAHEAFLCAIEVGQLLASMIEEGSAPTDAVRAAEAALAVLMDLLAPGVSRADRALRDVLFHGESLEQALEHIG